MVPEGYTEWRHAINNVSLLRASCSEHLKLRGVLKWKRGEWNAPKVTVTNPGAKQDGWRKKKHKNLDWVSKGIVTRIGQLSTIYWGWTELTSIGVHSIWKLNRDLTIARGRMSSVHKPVRTPPPHVCRGPPGLYILEMTSIALHMNSTVWRWYYTDKDVKQRKVLCVWMCVEEGFLGILENGSWPGEADTAREWGYLGSRPISLRYTSYKKAGALWLTAIQYWLIRWLDVRLTLGRRKAWSRGFLLKVDITWDSIKQK